MSYDMKTVVLDNLIFHPDNPQVRVHANEKRIAVFHGGKEIYAVADEKALDRMKVFLYEIALLGGL